MDDARGFQARTTDDSALLRKAAARVRLMRLALALALGTAFTETAVASTVVTDSSWLATNAAPAAAWNSDPSFDTTGWINAFVIAPACSNGADCIWYDGEFSATQFAWLRKTFTISNPVSSAVLVGGVNDDCDIYVNGTLVLGDHSGVSETFGPIDIAPYLVQGVNLIAVAAADNFAFGQQHAFEAALTIDEGVQSAAVPTISPWMSALLALVLASSAVLFIRRNG